MAALVLNQIDFVRGDKKIIDGVSLTVKDGEVVGLVGPSGAGKSTLLRLAAGLLTPTHGNVTTVAPGAIGFVFQSPELLPWRTALQNVLLPFEISGAVAGKERDTAMAELTAVGLGDSSNLLPHQLSGGMQMRASLARALVNAPELLLLDEPFAALDELTRRSLIRLLSDTLARRAIPTLFVSHSVQEAVYLCDRILILSGTGRLTMEISTGTDRDENPIERLETVTVQDTAAHILKAMAQ